MKVIITGGTGLIGRALSKQLIEDGDDVVLLSRSPHRPPGLPDDVRIVTWDGNTGDGWSDELPDSDAIVNLAGANLSGGRWTEANKRLIRESRLNAGNAVLDAVRATGHAPARMIQASGISYYGHRDEQFIDESEPNGSDFLASVCADWETSTRDIGDLGTNRVVTRLGPVLNLDDGALPPIAMPFHFYLGGPMGSGTQGLSWTHLDDVVAAFRFLLRDSDLDGTVNLCSPHPVSNREFSQTVGRVTNRPSFFPVPGVLLRAALGEVADTVLLGQFAVPRRLADAGFRFKYPDVELALRNLLANERMLPGTRLFRRGAAAAFRMLLP